MRSSPQVALYEWFPASLLFLRDARVAVTRKIYEHKPVVDSKEIDLTGATRRSADAGKGFPAYQAVEQGRLADVGAAGKCYFRKGGIGAPAVLLRHSADELNIPDDESLVGTTRIRPHSSALLNRRAIRRTTQWRQVADGVRSPAPRPSSSRDGSAPSHELHREALRCRGRCRRGR